jgi:hypothetical protein
VSAENKRWRGGVGALQAEHPALEKWKAIVGGGEREREKEREREREREGRREREGGGGRERERERKERERERERDREGGRVGQRVGWWAGISFLLASSSFSFKFSVFFSQRFMSSLFLRWAWRYLTLPYDHLGGWKGFDRLASP